MIGDQLRIEVLEWIKNDPDKNTADQLNRWLEEGNEKELNRCFNGFLQFGTAGLRGPVGPGPSCMNRAVVSRTASGIVAFMKKNNLTSVVIGKDARHGSNEFAQDSAEIFSGAGIKTYVLPRALPTPVLAFAVNKLKVDVGIMVTASHNPAADNGYKVYLGNTLDGVKYRGSQIVAPALHGVGTEVFLKVFEKAKFVSPILVAEQVKPDPDFPTTPFPNPEEVGAIDLAIKYAKESNADLVIANDPDADRCAVAVNDPLSGWRMLRGDEVGVILGNYLIKNNKSASKAVANSLVSSTLLGKIAKKNGVNFHETLTGFKWISKVDDLLFGYEEAIGYCVDPTVVNDKDGISAALTVIQLANELRKDEVTLLDYLNTIGEEYGFHETEQISIRFSDLSQIDKLLSNVIKNPPIEILGNKLLRSEDLSALKGMPTPGVRLWYENQTRVIIRPSGTEPKIKCYIEVVSNTKDEAKSKVSQIKEALTKVLS